MDFINRFYWSQFVLITVWIFVSVGQTIAQETIEIGKMSEAPKCETVAHNAQLTISNLSSNDIPEINAILDSWESICGKSEPQQRVKILLEIKTGTFSAENYKNYYIFNKSIFSHRMTIIQDTLYDNRYVYQKYTSYYDFVPIGEAFDQWTIDFANQLKDQLDKKSDAYLLCVLFSEGNKKFTATIHKNIYRNSIIRQTMQPYLYTLSFFSFVGGAWFPLNKDRTNFGISPQLGIRVGFPLNLDWRLEFGITGKIWTEKNDIVVHYENVDSLTTSDESVAFGVSVERHYYLTEKLIWDINAGVAYEMLSTKIAKPDNDDDDDNNNTVSVGTANFTFGTNLRIKTTKKNSLALNINYHFVPFNLDKDLKTRLNNQAISTNLIYRF